MNKITLEELIAQVDEIPAIPGAVVKIIKMLNEDVVDIHLVEKQVLKDKGLASTLLKIANSAFYRGRRTVDSVKDAMVLLGLDTVRTLIFSSAVIDIASKELTGYCCDRQTLWKKTQISAYVAQMIAVKVSFPNPDKAYLGALLRDIGMVVLDGYVYENKEEIKNKLENEDIQPYEIEEAVIGFNHSQAGAMLIKKWNLSDDLSEVVEFHHNPLEVTSNRELVSIVHIADHVVFNMEKCKKKDMCSFQFFNETLEILGLNEEDLEKLALDVNEIIEEDGFFLID